MYVWKWLLNLDFSVTLFMSHAWRMENCSMVVFTVTAVQEKRPESPQGYMRTLSFTEDTALLKRSDFFFFFFYFGGACIEDENKFCQILEQRSLPCRMSCFWAVQIFMKNAPLQATWVGILELSFIIFLMLFNKLFLHRFDHFSTVSCAPVLNTVTGESPLNRTWWSFCF